MFCGDQPLEHCVPCPSLLSLFSFLIFSMYDHSHTICGGLSLPFLPHLHHHPSLFLLSQLQPPGKPPSSPSLLSFLYSSTHPMYSDPLVHTHLGPLTTLLHSHQLNFPIQSVPHITQHLNSTPGSPPLGPPPSFTPFLIAVTIRIWLRSYTPPRSHSGHGSDRAM